MTERGYSWSGSRELRDMFVGMQKAEDARFVSTPCVRYSEAQWRDSYEVDGDRHRAFRRGLGLLLYLAQDRPDLQYPGLVASQASTAPTNLDEWVLKRAAKYLRHHGDFCWLCEWADDDDDQIRAYTDSDWGADRRSRRSVSACVMVLGRTVVRTWSRLQGSVSLSSAEAEYYAMIAGLSEAMGLQHFLEELGMKLSIRLLTDSSAAKAGAERLGLLHQKHMKIRDLFLKDLVAQGAVTVEKIGTKENPADFQ